MDEPSRGERVHRPGKRQRPRAERDEKADGPERGRSPNRPANQRSAGDPSEECACSCARARARARARLACSRRPRPSPRLRDGGDGDARGATGARARRRHRERIRESPRGATPSVRARGSAVPIQHTTKSRRARFADGVSPRHVPFRRPRRRRGGRRRRRRRRREDEDAHGPRRGVQGVGVHRPRVHRVQAEEHEERGPVEGARRRFRGGPAEFEGGDPSPREKVPSRAADATHAPRARVTGARRGGTRASRPRPGVSPRAASDALGRDAVPPEEEEEVEPCAAPLTDPVRPRATAAAAEEKTSRRGSRAPSAARATDSATDSPKKTIPAANASITPRPSEPPPIPQTRLPNGVFGSNEESSPRRTRNRPFVDLTLPLRAPPPSRRTRQPRLRANPDAVRASREPRDERERGESDRRRRRRPGQAVAGAQARSNRALVSVEPRAKSASVRRRNTAAATECRVGTDREVRPAAPHVAVSRSAWTPGPANRTERSPGSSSPTRPIGSDQSGNNVASFWTRGPALDPALDPALNPALDPALDPALSLRIPALASASPTIERIVASYHCARGAPRGRHLGLGDSAQERPRCIRGEKSPRTVSPSRLRSRVSAASRPSRSNASATGSEHREHRSAAATGEVTEARGSRHEVTAEASRPERLRSHAPQRQ